MPALSIKHLICLGSIKNQLENQFRCPEMKGKKKSPWNVCNIPYFSSINHSAAETFKIMPMTKQALKRNKTCSPTARH